MLVDYSACRPALSHSMLKSRKCSIQLKVSQMHDSLNPKTGCMSFMRYGSASRYSSTQRVSRSLTTRQKYIQTNAEIKRRSNISMIRRNKKLTHTHKPEQKNDLCVAAVKCFRHSITRAAFQIVLLVLMPYETAHQDYLLLVACTKQLAA